MIAILAVTSIVQSLFVPSAYALTRYFNCVTSIANGNGTMTLDNVKCCYYKVIQGARDADAVGNKIRQGRVFKDNLQYFFRNQI